ECREPDLLGMADSGLGGGEGPAVIEVGDVDGVAGGGEAFGDGIHAGGPTQGGVQQYEGAHGKSSQQSDSAAVAVRNGEGVGAGCRPILRPLLGGVFEQLAGLQPVVDSGIGP